jgi:hypothetical protein
VIEYDDDSNKTNNGQEEDEEDGVVREIEVPARALQLVQFS